MKKSINQRTELKQISLQLICQLGCLLFILLAISGCSKRYSDLPAYWPIPFKEYENQSVGRFKTSFLAQQIDDYYRGSNPGPIGVTTFVNLDDLYNTSSFGRMVGEQLMSELVMRGYDVIELRQGDALRFVRDGGEFALSREMGAVRRSQDLGGVVVGTYVASPVRVYLNARLLDPSSSAVVSAASAEMERTTEIAKLLRIGGVPAALERIPVKHMAYGDVPLSKVSQGGQYYDWEETSGPYANQPKAVVSPVLPPVVKEKGHSAKTPHDH